MDCALAISGYDYLRALPSFREGLFQVQDVSSMKAALMAAAPKEGDILSLTSAQRLAARAFIWQNFFMVPDMVEARDLTEYKVGLIQDNIDRTAAYRIFVPYRWMPQFWMRHLSEKADVVLADLPCSGLGVLSKKT